MRSVTHSHINIAQKSSRFCGVRKVFDQSAFLGMPWQSMDRAPVALATLAVTPPCTKNSRANWRNCTTSQQRYFSRHVTSPMNPLCTHWVRCYQVFDKWKILMADLRYVTIHLQGSIFTLMRVIMHRWSMEFVPVGRLNMFSATMIRSTWKKSWRVLSLAGLRSWRLKLSIVWRVCNM